MKKTAVIFLTFIYLVSTAGIAFSNFYCCGKLKETYIFYPKESSKNCKGNKLPGCCDTKVTYLKVKDNHTAPAQTKINLPDFNKIFLFFSPISSFRNANDCIVAIASAHSPPLLEKLPVYLLVCNFRI